MIESEIPLLGMKTHVTVQGAVQLFLLSRFFEAIEVALPTWNLLGSYKRVKLAFGYHLRACSHS